MITLGYEKFINGNPTTNGFDCGEESSPINLGWAGYKSDHNTRDSELGKSTQKRCYAYHFSTLRQFFDIRIQDISTIKRKYYYVIDVFDHDFWINPNARYPNIDPLAVKDIKNGKAKVLVLFTSESLKDNYDISGILNSWAANYGFPHRSIVLASGNFSFGNQIERDKCIVYIPYSIWEHSMKSLYDPNSKFATTIKSKVDREKLFLCYNRRAKYHRYKLVYNLTRNDLIKYGFVSLGKDIFGNRKDIPQTFLNSLPMTFDDTDLEINHATELVERDFLNSYVSLVTETTTNNGENFPSEKIFKPILALHPFIVLSSTGFLQTMKGFGYKTFSEWFDESYDLEMNLEKRIEMIINQIKLLSQKSKSELNDMLVEMLPILEHNLNTFLRRTEEKTFQEQLEGELWK